MQTNITITVLVVSVIIIENCTFIQCTVYIYIYMIVPLPLHFSLNEITSYVRIYSTYMWALQVSRLFTSIHILSTHCKILMASTNPDRYPEEAPMWRFPEIGVPLNHPCYFRIFPHKQSSNWGSPNLGNLHTVSISIMSQHAKPGWFVNHWWNP